MTDLRGSIRRLVERALPWFDRDTEDRASRAFEQQRHASRIVRQHAQSAILRDAYRDYGHRVNGRE